MKKSYADVCLERASMATKGPWKNDCGNGQIETSKWRILICERVGNYERRQDALSMYCQIDQTWEGDTPVRYIESSLPEEVKELLQFNNEYDMEFIAHARQDIPELARRLKKAIDILTKLHNKDPFFAFLYSDIKELERMPEDGK